MSERIPKALRFEVFKRDSFTCQYCGRRAPDIVLHCDHATPVAAGGPTELLNLIAACSDCNLGKGARKISDATIVTKQMDQLAELQQRREQLEMLLAWRQELGANQQYELDRVCDYWTGKIGYHLSDYGKEGVRRLIKRFGVERLLEAMDAAASQYLERDQSGDVTEASADKAFDYIGRIASVTRAEEREPGTRRLFYVRGILRNRLQYVNERMAMSLMKDALNAGISVDLIERTAKEARSWTQFRTLIETYTAESLEQSALRDEAITDAIYRVKQVISNAPAALAAQVITEAFEFGITPQAIRRTLETVRDWPQFLAWIDAEMGRETGDGSDEAEKTLSEWRRLNDIISSKLK